MLGVFHLALHSPWRDTVPPFGSDFPVELARQHGLMLEKRPESNPGQFKTERNRAGGTWFVEPQFGRGTLIEDRCSRALSPRVYRVPSTIRF